MKVRIAIDKCVALKAGLDEHGLKVVEVPAASLTPEQREVLSPYDKAYGSSDKPEADFYIDYRGKIRVATATPESVLQVLDGLVADRRVAEEEKRRKHEESVARWLQCPLEDWVRRDGIGYVVVPAGDSFYGCPDDERLAERRREAEALAARTTADVKEKADRERRAENERIALEAEKRRVGYAALRSWAETNGSVLLRERMSEGFEWEGLARVEFCDRVIEELGLDLESANVPNGYRHLGSNARTTPRLHEIRTLKRIREMLAGKDAEASLEWASYADEDGETISRCELAIDVASPDGKTRRYEFVVPECEDASVQS